MTRDILRALALIAVLAAGGVAAVALVCVPMLPDSALNARGLTLKHAVRSVLP